MGTTDTLIEALYHPDSHVRWHAARALGQIGNPRGIDTLVEGLHDDHPAVRWATASVLASLDAQAIPSILRALIRRPMTITRMIKIPTVLVTTSRNDSWPMWFDSCAALRGMGVRPGFASLCLSLSHVQPAVVQQGPELLVAPLGNQRDIAARLCVDWTRHHAGKGRVEPIEVDEFRAHFQCRFSC